jgi:phosphoribosylaminoimidazole-succinocarboxamide synthase
VTAEGLPLAFSGKIRDVYEAGAGWLLMVASDRISAFDVVLPERIPGKGRVSAGLSAFWSKLLSGLAPSHLISTDPVYFPAGASNPEGDDLAGRAMLVRRAEMLPIECIVRGYLSGSAWKEYRASGTMHGVKLPAGLAESDELPEPAFTPSTKATVGHDENISREAAAEIVGAGVAKAAEELSLAVYERGRAWAAERGIIIADTKFELGFIDGQLCLCDEVLTPDSSRFWVADDWKPGTTPLSYDKQPVRDWAAACGWNRSPPPPHLPEQMVVACAERFATAYELLTGQPLSMWNGKMD